MIEKWQGKRVTVMGLGRFGGGVGVTRWLVSQGARVVVTDLASREKLTESLAQIAGLDVALRLSGHDEHDFRQTDLVVVSPAVPEDSPFLAAARSADVPITTEINLFVERCPACCVGVTGSVGKSTITAMIGHVLERAGTKRRSDEATKGSKDSVGWALPTDWPEDSVGRAPPTDRRDDAKGRRVWVGGNIGRSLLEELDQIRPDDIVVLELSSFQLLHTPEVRWSPHVAVISNVTPNHLDRHKTFAAYLAAKLNIVRFQEPGRDAIIIEDTPDLRRSFEQMFGDVSGVWRYGFAGDTPTAVVQSTAAVDCDDRRLRWPDLKLSVPGRHNRGNAAAALTVAHLLGVAPEIAATALATFEALPHRLQRVAVRDGVTYYNDSKSSTPEAAITALHAMDSPVSVILGGYDKGIDLKPMARVAAQRARFAACVGKTGPRLVEAVRAAGGTAELFGDLPAAFAACRQQARPGDAVLLSPGCASWDQFVDYRARGELFTRLATRVEP